MVELAHGKDPSLPAKFWPFLMCARASMQVFLLIKLRTWVYKVLAPILLVPLWLWSSLTGISTLIKDDIAHNETLCKAWFWSMIRTPDMSAFPVNGRIRRVHSLTPGLFTMIFPYQPCKYSLWIPKIIL